jgi:hypothetical protein
MESKWRAKLKIFSSWPNGIQGASHISDIEMTTKLVTFSSSEQIIYIFS